MKLNKQTGNPNYSGKSKLDSFTQYRNRSIILCIIILTGFFFFSRNRNNALVYVLPGEEALSITGHTGEEISVSYQDITSVELIDSIDFGEVVDGSDTRRSAAGLWQNTRWGSYHLFILHNVKKYIVLTTQTDVVVFNCESDSVTKSLYQAFCDLLSEKGLAGQIQFHP